VRQLRSRIRHGDLAAGDALPSERKLAEELNVNRGAVREALQRLSQSGLVSIRHGDSTRVADYRDSLSLDVLAVLLFDEDGRPDLKIMSDLADVAALVYLEIARKAAQNGGSELADELDARVAEMQEARGDVPATVIARGRFYLALVDAADNLVYSQLHNAFELATRSPHWQDEQPPEVAERAIELDRRLAAAIRSRDEDAARDVMRERTSPMAEASARGAPTPHVPASSRVRSSHIQDTEQISASERAFRSIRRQILRGELQPGDPLPAERDLAESLDLNRGALREALKRLAQSNLVHIRHGEPTRVVDYRHSLGIDVLADLLLGGDGRPDPKLGRDLFEAASLFGPHIARCAARNGGPEAAARLEPILADIEAAGSELPASWEARARFHRELGDIAGNLLLRVILNGCLAAMRTIEGALQGHAHERDPDQFQALTAAIQMRSEDTAANIMLEQGTSYSRKVVERGERARAPGTGTDRSPEVRPR